VIAAMPSTAPGDEQGETGPATQEGDPAQIVGRAAKETAGFRWTADELAEAEPMPLLPPPDGTPPQS
jgi:hypothetical protein